MADMTAKGRRPIGSRHGGAVLSESDVVAIKGRLSSETDAQIANDYPVTKAAIYMIRSGRHWKHVQRED